ncbi:putative Pilin, type IV [Candidatus Sulfopaludibacter sp. SbA4]|nr:putative Pilin, type IV [Candidatus Sulfopaludibacter sp. SbA4]
MRGLIRIVCIVGPVVVLWAIGCSVTGDRTPMYMRELAAIKAIQTIHTVQAQYFAEFGHYATSLTELGPPASGAPGPGAADLIGNDLAGGVKQGYRFSVTALPSEYTVNATPEVYGTSGSRSFYSDQTMAVRENYGPEPATASSKKMGAGVAK